MKKLVSIVSIILLTLSVIAVSCNSTEETPTTPSTPTTTDGTPVYGGSLTYAAPAWISSMNTLYAGQGQDGYFNGVFNHYIVGMDESQKVVPYAADRWEWTDSTTFRLYLREDVTFSNGEALTADDVVFTFEWGKNPDNKALWMNFYKLVTATKVDDYTVQFVTEDPTNWLAYLTNYAGNVLPKDTFEKWGSDYTQHPAGLGAFDVSDIVTGSSMTAVRSETFFLTDDEGNRLPYLDEVKVIVMPDPAVQVAALRAGQLDFCVPSTNEIPNFENDSNFTLYSGPSVTNWTVMLNKNIPPLDDVRIRKAISLAIDGQAIINGLYAGYGRAINSLYPPEVWYHNPSIPKPQRNLEEAKSLLIEAGHPNGFNMLILCLNDTMTVARSEAIQAQLKEIGINVTIEPMEPASAMARRNQKDWGGVNHNWTNITDPQIPLDGWFTAEAAYGFGHAVYDDVVPLIEEARVNFLDVDTRQQLYWEIELKLFDNHAQAWYMSPNNLSVAKKNLMGYGVGIGSMKYNNFRYWWSK